MVSIVYRVFSTTTKKMAILGIVYGFGFTTFWIFMVHSTFISSCLWALLVGGGFETLLQEYC
jgi:hypothetical protein